MTLTRLRDTALGLGLFLALSGAVLGVTSGLRLAAEVREELKQIATLGDAGLSLATEIFDRHGQKIGEVGEERRYFVKLQDLPAHVAQAFVSAEDKDFRTHAGIDPTAIVRAGLANIKGQRLSQGASTITQQVARLYFLDQEKSWTRKAKEAILAVAIERQLTKDRILELYLNKIYLGNRSYGIEAAARNYFRKDAADLSIGEAALLAGLPKSPSAYAPNKNPKRASERQAFVLRRLEEDGFLQKGDAVAWGKRVINVAAQPEDFFSKAPYFVVAVQKELARKLELAGTAPRQGLKIHTTLDWELQKAAAAALAGTARAAKGSAVYQGPEKARIEGAVFSFDPATGAVRASQGGTSFAKTQFDRTRLARRRLGGMMVPVYLSLALERGYTLASRVGDDPLGGRRQTAQSGSPTLYETVVKGMTIEAAPLFTALGAGSVIEHARRLGLAFEDEDLSLAIGTGESSPEDVARAYAAFVNGGRLVDPYMIERIEDAKGAVLYRAPEPIGGDQAMSAQSAFITYHLLKEAARVGHAIGVSELSPAVGAMATATDDLHDAWFAGVLPNLATAVWLGAETGSVRLGEHQEGAQALAVRLWTDMMRRGGMSYLESAPTVETPAGLSFARLTIGAGTSVPSQPFLAGTEPESGRARF